MQRLHRQGFVTFYRSWADVRARFQNPVVSKMAAAIKVREDGTKKVRLIIDMLRSGVNNRVKLTERIVLPRLMAWSRTFSPCCALASPTARRWA